MSKTYRFLVAPLVFFLGVTPFVFAQEKNAESDASPAAQARANTQRPAGNARQRAGLSPKLVLEKRFDRDAPQIGDPLPQVTVWDAEGNPFDLRSLRGNYTVLVFGCLT